MAHILIIEGDDMKSVRLRKIYFLFYRHFLCNKYVCEIFFLDSGCHVTYYFDQSSTVSGGLVSATNVTHKEAVKVNDLQPAGSNSKYKSITDFVVLF